MKIVTLTTDFGDFYPGVMKGVILSITPGCEILDISHNVEPQNVLQGAFLLHNSYKYFKKGTIHVAVVDPEVGSKRAAIAVESSDYVFIAPDNGIVYQAASENGIVRVYEINPAISELVGSLSSTFHGRDVFAPAAALFASGRWRDFDYFEEREVDEIKKLEIFDYLIKENYCRCKVVYVDRFGNLITNLRSEVISKLRAKSFYCRGVELPLVRSYSDVDVGEALALVGSFNTLELSLRNGNAAEMFGIRRGDVEIELEVVK